MPAPLAVASTLHGALYGLFPIGWIVVAAVFLYRITVETGQFDTIRDSIASLTADRRLQALLIAFSFGAFLEGRGRLRHARRDLGRHAGRASASSRCTPPASA